MSKKVFVNFIQRKFSHRKDCEDAVFVFHIFFKLNLGFQVTVFILTY